MAGTFPDAHAFYDWLRARKARFTGQRAKPSTYQDEALGRSLVAFEKEIRLQHKRIPREQAFAIVQRAINQAFARVAQCAGTCGRRHQDHPPHADWRSNTSVTWSRRCALDARSHGGSSPRHARLPMYDG